MSDISQNTSTTSTKTEDESTILTKLRNDFFEINRVNIDENQFDERDLDRLKYNDEWLKAFYLKSSKNTDETLKYLFEVLKWRKDFNANDLLKPDQLPFRQEILAKGAYFIRHKDKNGIPLLHVVSRAFKKGEYPNEEVFKFIAYHFEKSYKFNTQHQLVVLFDLYNSGFGNFDMEIIQFMTNCLKTYYPLMTRYVMVYDAPFVFQALWRVIKLWLNQQTVEKVKFVNKQTVKEFVDDSQLLTYMGGTDDYKPGE